MLTEANVERIIAAVSENTAAVAENLSQCFDVAWILTSGDSGVWSDASRSSEFYGPGLAALFDVGGVGLVVLLPESLPLPAWYKSPNESQKARLETLAMEWSMNLFPPDMEPSRFATKLVPRLQDFVEECAPAEWAATMAFNVMETGGQPAGSLLMIWPLMTPQFETKAAAVASPAAEGPPPPATEPESAAVPPMEDVPAGLDPFKRLRGLPVQVSVRLAEKKITVSQLLGISSGALISFPKSCEAMLDLYVNNARYCRGEAVKIGENFGLKINEVGTTEERASKILNG